LRHSNCSSSAHARAFGRSALAQVALVFICVAGSTAALHAQQMSGDSSYRSLQPGDYIRIAVWHHDELSGEFQVGADGTILQPYYRTVRVGGVPLPELEGRVKTFLAQYENNPQIVVVPLFRVAVAGEVNRPDVYRVGPDVTVASAVGLAGGYTPDARLGVVKLVRNANTRQLDLHNMSDALTALRSGDQIMVEQKRSTVARIREVFTEGTLMLYGVVLLATAIKNNF
jgi:polysaccharide export outer membrane protein